MYCQVFFNIFWAISNPKGKDKRHEQTHRLIPNLTTRCPQTAAYGHFGRGDGLDLPWERLDMADVLRSEYERGGAKRKTPEYRRKTMSVYGQIGIVMLELLC